MSIPKQKTPSAQGVETMPTTRCTLPAYLQVSPEGNVWEGPLGRILGDLLLQRGYRVGVANLRATDFPERARRGGKSATPHLVHKPSPILRRRRIAAVQSFTQLYPLFLWGGGGLPLSPHMHRFVPPTPPHPRPQNSNHYSNSNPLVHGACPRSALQSMATSQHAVPFLRSTHPTCPFSREQPTLTNGLSLIICSLCSNSLS